MIVVVSLSDYIFAGIDTSAFKIFRLFRTLRPLRFISRNVGLKLIVTALFESVTGIMNVLLIVILIWLMFAIFGVNTLKNKSFYCDIP